MTITINASEYGAHPDASPATNRTAIQRALDAIPAGGTVHIPSGTYQIASTLGIPRACTLEGDGPDATILAMPTGFAGAGIGITATDPTVIDGTTITGLGLVGGHTPGASMPSHTGINALSSALLLDDTLPQWNITVRNCAIANFYTGFYAAWAKATVADCTITDCGNNGIRFGGCETVDAHRNTISGEFSHGSPSGVLVVDYTTRSCDNVRVTDNLIATTAGPPAGASFGMTLQSEWSSLEITGNTIVGSMQYGIWLIGERPAGWVGSINQNVLNYTGDPGDARNAIGVACANGIGHVAVTGNAMSGYGAISAAQSAGAILVRACSAAVTANVIPYHHGIGLYLDQRSGFAAKVAASANIFGNIWQNGGAVSGSISWLNSGQHSLTLVGNMCAPQDDTTYPPITPGTHDRNVRGLYTTGTDKIVHAAANDFTACGTPIDSASPVLP